MRLNSLLTLGDNEGGCKAGADLLKVVPKSLNLLCRSMKMQKVATNGEISRQTGFYYDAIDFGRSNGTRRALLKPAIEF